MLITALETAPGCTGRGYATELLSHSLQYLRGQGASKAYVHIRRSNAASLRVHRRCGFQKTARGARLLDGSYHSDYDTFEYIL